MEARLQSAEGHRLVAEEALRELEEQASSASQLRVRCAVLRCAVLRCAVLWRAVLPCASEL